MLFQVPPRLDPPERLLCGPGPSNVSPSALSAMRTPMLGHLDPDFHRILLEVTGLLRQAYRARDAGLVLALQATGTSGMETGLVNLLEPGDVAIVATCGYFGRRICELARRCGARVVPVEADWGECVSNDRLLDALDDHPDARLLAVVHAETSTGVEHPLQELSEALRGQDVLLMADCVTSLGGIELEFDAWGIDYAFSCSQKCLGAPPGLSPIAVSERALEQIRRRRTPVPFTYDLLELERYWVERPAVYHHTAPVLQLYALHEALREVVLEGLEERWRRHEQAGRFLQAKLSAWGLELLADFDRQLAPLTAVLVPDAIDAKQVQTRMLREYGIEIGGGLGPSAPSMWRIGLMGHNARVEVADRVLAALDQVLAPERVLAAA
jgi:alanine-glyoxylate transaminase / serine-glyoxylate transaminase / serine-pyruvate transaminase